MSLNTALCRKTCNVPNQVTISGNIDVGKFIEKQLRFAAASTVTRLAYESQAEVIRPGGALDREFVLRGKWYAPTSRYGIKVRRATKINLTSQVYTAADWLLEAEGHAAGVKVPDKHGGHLAVPDVKETRGGIQRKVKKSEKARALLDNPAKSRAFKITTQSGYTLILQRKGGRGGRGGKTSRLVTKYIFRNSVKVPHQSTVVTPTHDTVRLKLAQVWNEQLRIALATAKGSLP